MTTTYAPGDRVVRVSRVHDADEWGPPIGETGTVRYQSVLKSDFYGVEWDTWDRGWTTLQIERAGAGWAVEAKELELIA